MRAFGRQFNRGVVHGPSIMTCFADVQLLNNRSTGELCVPSEQKHMHSIRYIPCDANSSKVSSPSSETSVTFTSLFAAGAAALSVMTLCCDVWLLLVMISHELCKQARLQAGMRWTEMITDHSHNLRLERGLIVRKRYRLVGVLAGLQTSFADTLIAVLT